MNGTGNGKMSKLPLVKDGIHETIGVIHLEKSHVLLVERLTGAANVFSGRLQDCIGIYRFSDV